MKKNFIGIGTIVFIITLVIFVGVKSVRNDIAEDETEESHRFDGTNKDLPELPLDGLEDYGEKEVQDSTQI